MHRLGAGGSEFRLREAYSQFGHLFVGDGHVSSKPLAEDQTDKQTGRQSDTRQTDKRKDCLDPKMLKFYEDLPRFGALGFANGL